MSKKEGPIYAEEQVEILEEELAKAKVEIQRLKDAAPPKECSQCRARWIKGKWEPAMAPSSTSNEGKERGQGEVAAIIVMGLVAIGLWSWNIYSWTHPEPKEVTQAREACFDKCAPNYGRLYKGDCYCGNELRKTTSQDSRETK